MAKHNDLIALAERVEAASGADAFLSEEICKAVSRSWSWRDTHFTGSLDAAMTLVPKGWDWNATSFGEDGTYAAVWKHGYHDDTAIRAHGPKTPALALTAASLRALAMIEQEKSE